MNILKSQEGQSNSIGSIKKLFKSLLISYLITLLILLAFSIIITYTDMSEAFGDVIVTCATYLSTLAAGFFAAVGTNKRGWLTGAISGMCYIVLLIVISGLIKGFSIDSGTFIAILLSSLTGALGGIIGINTKRS